MKKPIKRRYREKITGNTFMVASTHGDGRVHDYMKGWGTVAKDGKSILWDDWRPIPKKHQQKLERHWKKHGGAFAKWMFPVIKNMSWPPMSASDFMTEFIKIQPMED